MNGPTAEDGQEHAELVFNELQTHLAASDAEQRLAARAWAKRHAARSEADVALVELDVADWPTSGSHHGEPMTRAHTTAAWKALEADILDKASAGPSPIGSSFERPRPSDVWVVVGTRGVCVGWWRQEDLGDLTFDEQGALDDVDAAAMAEMWIGPAVIGTDLISVTDLERKWSAAGVDSAGKVPRWLLSDAAIDQVCERFGLTRAEQRRRDGLTL